jgi:hypothetical protein
VVMLMDWDKMLNLSSLQVRLHGMTGALCAI